MLIYSLMILSNKCDRISVGQFFKQEGKMWWRDYCRRYADDILNIKIISVVFLNYSLIHYDVLKGITNIVLFNVGVVLVWFGLYLRRVRKIYEYNLSYLPTISKSIPEGDPIRIENEIEKRRAMQSAIRCHKWESLNW